MASIDHSLFIKRVGGVIAVFILLLVAGFCSAQKLAVPAQWKDVLALVRKQFPDVPQVSTSALATRIEKGEEIIIIDAREPGEFEVSRLPGAINVQTVEGAGELSKDAEIIVYCSVGYRSSALAQLLRKAGFSKSSNLEGSLFQWANEDRPMVDAAGVATTRVHPYSDKWGDLLNGEKVEITYEP